MKAAKRWERILKAAGERSAALHSILNFALTSVAHSIALMMSEL